MMRHGIHHWRTIWINVTLHFTLFCVPLARCSRLLESLIWDEWGDTRYSYPSWQWLAVQLEHTYHWDTATLNQLSNKAFFFQKGNNYFILSRGIRQILVANLFSDCRENLLHQDSRVQCNPHSMTERHFKRQQLHTPNSTKMKLLSYTTQYTTSHAINV